jgi:tetratricopeptide (TPR) repeat protein
VLCPADRTLSMPPTTKDLDGCDAPGLTAEQTAYAWYTLGGALGDNPDALAVAVAAFERADVAGATRVAVTARIRQGATLLRLDLHREALDAFARALALGPDADREIVVDYIAYAIVEDDTWLGVEDAIARVARIVDSAGARAEIFARMGALYTDRANPVWAETAYRAALDADPLARAAPAWHAAVVTALMQARYFEKVAPETDRFRAAYAEDGAWWAKHGRDADAVEGLRAAELQLERAPSYDGPGPLDSGAVDEVLRRARAVLARCARQRAVRGVLTLTVGTNGAVSATSTTGIDEDAARCITGIARRWTFPAPDDVAQVEIPLRLEPAQ